MAFVSVVVKRWRRFGHDRLYVAASDGTKIGYWDLETGQAVPESPDLAEVLASALVDWRAANAGKAPSVHDEAPTPEPTVDPDPQEAAWTDLAHNVAGAEAREKARELREEEPVRAVLARVLRVKTEERAWRVGAKGEELVGDQLAKLAKREPAWRFLHAVPVGSRGSDIDHVAIGPAGVLTINTKNHPDGRVHVTSKGIRVNGHPTYYVRNSSFEAERASRLLSERCGFLVVVRGVVAIVHAVEVTIKQQPVGVHVVPRRRLRHWLAKEPVTLDEDQIGSIFEVARRSTTWTG